MTQPATPLPWESNYAGVIFGDIDNPEHDGDSPLIGHIDGHGKATNEANAAFIVKACNSHGKLMTACKNLLDAAIAEYMWKTKGEGDPQKVTVFKEAMDALSFAAA